jgi:capsular polysaccharide export protein
VDERGIYYDPERSSDLEHLLQTTVFSPALLDRAEALRRDLIVAGISKYGSDGDPLPDRPLGRRLVLVAGQVEDDQSVLLAGSGLAGNLDLLARTRALEPEAEIWFRPHPDVDAGHRLGALADADALLHADRVVRGGGMPRLLDLVDGVHVLSSLTGFEALIRDREVVVHGSPFFAGWGLTRDMGAIPSRRRRRLALLELIAGTLILYPRYLDPVTCLPCPVEVLVSRFGKGAIPAGGWINRLRRIQGRLTRKSF